MSDAASIVTTPLMLNDYERMAPSALKADIASDFRLEGDPETLIPEDVLVASMTTDGTESSAFHLLRAADGSLLLNHAGHCSCYGYEEQWTPEPTSLAELKRRVESGWFVTDDAANGRIKDFIRALPGYDEA